MRLGIPFPSPALPLSRRTCTVSAEERGRVIHRSSCQDLYNKPFFISDLDYGRMVPALSAHELGELTVTAPG